MDPLYVTKDDPGPPHATSNGSELTNSYTPNFMTDAAPKFAANLMTGGRGVGS